MYMYEGRYWIESISYLISFECLLFLEKNDNGKRMSWMKSRTWIQKNTKHYFTYDFVFMAFETLILFFLLSVLRIYCIYILIPVNRFSIFSSHSFFFLLFLFCCLSDFSHNATMKLYGCCLDFSVCQKNKIK